MLDDSSLRFICNRVKEMHRMTDKISVEMTKQWLVLPLIEALGYKVYSYDIVSGYRIGETKYDFILKSGNEMAVKMVVKPFKLNLKDINMSLYRRSSDEGTIVITNGYQYIFLDGSDQCIRMDIRIPSDEGMRKLGMCTKERLDKARKYDKFTQMCSEVFNSIPD